MAPRNDSFFKRLTTLFRSGPSIQRKVKGLDYRSYYDNELIRGNYGYRAPFPFGRESSPFSVLGTYGILDRNARYAEFAEMEYCLSGRTLIATPNSPKGFMTLEELAELCENDPNYNFIVYAYDAEKGHLVPAIGKNARQTREEHVYCVKFDSGKEIIGTADHRLMKRDGTYQHIECLKKDDYLMPFKNEENHKVVSVKYYGCIPVYDLTVDKYHNFATDSVISHNCPEIAASLNVISDEVVAGDEKNRAFHIFTRNPEIKRALEELFYDIANIDYNLRPWVRNLIKYGDFFAYNEVVPDIGIINVQPIPVNEMEREEGYDQNDPYAVRFKWLTRGNRYLENWQISHMRLLGNDLFNPYGTSILEPARRLFRQLCHLEGTKVWVKGQGIKQIETVKPGDVVWTYSPEQKQIIETKVKHCIVMGKQDVVKVKTQHRDIFVTSNHGLMIKDKNDEEYYKKAENLVCSFGKGGDTGRKADSLILPVRIEGKKTLSFSINQGVYYVKLRNKVNYESNGIMALLRSLNLETTLKNTHSFLNGQRRIRKTDFDKLSAVIDFSTVDYDFYYCKSKNKSVLFDKEHTSLKLDKKFFRLFGFMLGDGWVYKSTFGYSLGINEERNEYYENIVRQVFLRPFKKLKTASKQPGFKSASLNFFCKEISNLFRQMDFRTGFANKIIPNWAFNLAQNERIELIRGIFDADGYYKGKKLQLSNKQLLEGVVNLAQQSGIRVGRIYSVEGSKKFDKSFQKIVTRQPSYYVQLDLNHITKETIYEKVISVTPYGRGETYDLEVEHENHNFVAEGIVTHNTMTEDAMLTYRVVRAPERRVFYIDVGNIAPNDVPTFMETVKQTMSSNNIADRTNGRIDQRFNPANILEDYYIPVRGGQTGTKIDTLAGGQNTTAVEDVEYLQKKLFAALQVPKAYVNYTENLCLLGHTKIIDPTTGRTRTIEDLANKFKDLKDVYVWSCKEDGTIVPGHVINAFKTKEVNEYIKVTLDDGNVIECTPNHPFMLRNGKYCEAQELEADVSLMPFYSRISTKPRDQLQDYQMIYDNCEKKWIYAHQKIAKNLLIEKDNSAFAGDIDVIHHKDFNKSNNEPENLIWMGRKAHSSYHCEQAKGVLNTPEARAKVNKLRETKEFWEKHQKGIEDYWNDPKRSGKRRKNIGRRSKELNLVKYAQDAILAIRREKVPSYKEVVAYAKTLEDNFNFETVKHHFGCSYNKLREVIRQEGFKGWNDFSNKVLDKKQPKINRNMPAVKKINVYEQIASTCKSIQQFCDKTNITRQRFYRFLKEQDIVPVEWFKKNLGRVPGQFYHNHKVAKVEWIKCATSLPVYDLTVEGYHNFAIVQNNNNSGIFVHNSAKASLSQMDVRFSRTIAMLQRVVLAELNKLAMIHLYAKGFDGEDLIDFDLKLSNPSTIAIQQKLEVLSTKFDIAGKAKDTALVDEDWIQKRVLDLTEDEIIRVEAGRRKDKVRTVEIEAIAVKENLPQKNTMVDPFDSSNYAVTGDNVKRNEPVSGNEIQNGAVPVPQDQTVVDRASTVSLVGYPNGEQVREKESEGGAPVKATPFLKLARDKEKRRVTYSGREAISMPDFKAMLDAKRNRALKDIYDKETVNLRAPFSLSEVFNTRDMIEESKEVITEQDAMLNEAGFNFRAFPVVPRELQSIIKNLKDHLDDKVNGYEGNSLLIENVNEQDNDIDDEEETTIEDSDESDTTSLEDIDLNELD